MASTRRLAAIMFTDIVGYTALAQRDEASALKLLDRHNRLLRPIFPRFHGKEVKAIGDSFLVEFKSALDATNCAIEIQRLLHEDSFSTPDESRIRVRIGIHLGDVVHKSGDVFGDSVNIASRMEPLAEPGGICISEQVFVQVRNKVPNKLDKLDPKTLKNVQFPMDIYRVVLPWTVREPRSANSGPSGLAVLPFTNISPDPKDEYFAEGLTEELITVLSQLRKFPVIARTSVMQYKATTKAVSQIGSELGISTILEGSVRKAGNRLRISAQLIDAASQRHIWANSYDRELDDVFAVQTDIAKQVAEALKIELRVTEVARLEARPTVRPDSYLAYLKGRTLLQGDTTKASLYAAKEQFEIAISLDPQNAAAYSGLADTIIRLGWWHRDVPAEESEATARRLVDRAIELDPNLAEAHASLGLVLWRDSIAVAKKEVNLALSLNPSYSQAHNTLANMFQDENRPEEALEEFTLAEEADPHWPLNLYHMAYLLIWLGRLDEAFVKLQRLGTLVPDERIGIHAILAEYYLARSDLEQCLKEIQRTEQAREEPRDKQLVRALYHAWVGEREQSRAILRHDETLPDRPTAAQHIARVYAELGDLDDCFRWLAKAYATTNLSLQRWRLDPRLEHVRRDPRFDELLKKRNLA